MQFTEIKASVVSKESLSEGPMKGPMPDKVPKLTIIAEKTNKAVTLYRFKRTAAQIKKGVMINALVKTKSGLNQLKKTVPEVIVIATTRITASIILLVLIL